MLQQLDTLLNIDQSYAMVSERATRLVMTGDLRPKAAVFYTWMCERANADGELWWSIEAMAREFQCVARTISGYLKDLVACSLIVRCQRLARSAITQIVAHPKVTNRLKRKMRPETEETSNPDPGDQAKPDPADQGSEEDHRKKTVPNPPPTPPRESEPEPKPEPEPDGDGVDFERLGDLWRIAAEAGYPAFKGNQVAFLKSPDLLTLLLELPDESIVWAFESITTGPRKYFPRIPLYWLKRLTEEAAKYTPPRPAEPVEEPTAAPETPVSESLEAPDWAQPREWSEVLEAIKGMVPEATYNRWFTSIVTVLQAGELWLCCLDEFDAGFSEKNFMGLIEIHASKAFGPVTVRFCHRGMDLTFIRQEDDLGEVVPRAPQPGSSASVVPLTSPDVSQPPASVSQLPTPSDPIDALAFESELFIQLEDPGPVIPVEIAKLALGWVQGRIQRDPAFIDEFISAPGGTDLERALILGFQPPPDSIDLARFEAVPFQDTKEVRRRG